MAESDDAWELDSANRPPSRTLSRQTSMNVEGRKIKGLESIYLQRLEAHPITSGRNKQTKKTKTKAKFRIM